MLGLVSSTWITLPDVVSCSSGTKEYGAITNNTVIPTNASMNPERAETNGISMALIFVVCEMADRTMAPSQDASAIASGVIGVVALCTLGYIIYSYSRRVEGMTEAAAETPTGAGGPIPADPAEMRVASVDFPSAGTSTVHNPKDPYPKDRLVTSDLLPKDASNDLWSRVNPAGQGDVDDKNYLTAGYHSGVNTVGGSLRNASLQIRSEPINPRSRVSVWNESTIEPDLNKRPFEIDG